MAKKVTVTLKFTDSLGVKPYKVVNARNTLEPRIGTRLTEAEARELIYDRQVEVVVK